ncbi:MAG TPA: ABC transporter permease subunit [Oscillatoriaceae cyanobacterium]
MNTTLLFQEIRRALPFFALLALGLAVYSIVFVAVFPSVQSEMAEMLKAVPPLLRPLVKAHVGLDAFENFLATGYLHPVALGLMASWAVSCGAQAVAGEIEQGTLGWMLAYPIGRVRFLLTKAWVLLGGAVLLAALLGLGFWQTATLLGVSHLNIQTYVLLSANTALLYGAIGMLTLWASAASSERGKPGMLGGGLFVVSFLLNYVTQLWAPLHRYRCLSLFAYYDPRAVLLAHGLPWQNSLVLGGLLVVGLLAAVTTFARRELTI